MNYPNMTDRELLSLLIMEKQSEHVSEKLLDEFKTLPDLFMNSEIEQLLNINGIGERRAAQLKALAELSKRLFVKSSRPITKISSPYDAANVLMPDMQHLKMEQLKIMLLDTKNKIISIETISIGSLNASVVHPREVYVPAIKRSANGIIAAHNHPSGDPNPSQEDINLTKRLHDVGKLVGIEFLDHIIIGCGTYVSLKEKGII